MALFKPQEPFICLRCRGLAVSPRQSRNLSLFTPSTKLRSKSFVPAPPQRNAFTPRDQQYGLLSQSNSLPLVRHSVFLPARSYAAVANHEHTALGAAFQKIPSYEANGVTKLSHRSLISITGPDAAKFLQGMVTNNVEPADVRGVFFTGLLNAQGRVLSDAFVYPRTDAKGNWWAFIEVDAKLRDTMIAHLKRHKLRARVKIEKNDSWGVWALWTEDQEGTTENDSLLSGETGDTQMAVDPRLPGFGYRILAKDSAMDPTSSEIFDGSQTAETRSFAHPTTGQPIPAVPLKSYHIRRYTQGLPEGPAEMIPGSALPLEANMDFMRGIDFKKGCYVGQELTIRTKHTGVVRKRILPVLLYAENSNTSDALAESIPGGTTIKRIDTADQEEDRSGTQDFTLTGRETGRFLAGIGNIGLALCRLEYMTKDGQEFGMKWLLGASSEPGGDVGPREAQEQSASVRIKTWVPGWHEIRRKELERKSQHRLESLDELREEHLDKSQPSEERSGPWK